MTLGRLGLGNLSAAAFTVCPRPTASRQGTRSTANFVRIDPRSRSAGDAPCRGRAASGVARLDTAGLASSRLDTADTTTSALAPGQGALSAHGARAVTEGEKVIAGGGRAVLV